MTDDDLLYFQLRAREERQRAIAAADHTVAKVHAELARLYEAAAGRLHEGERSRSSPVAVNRSHELLKNRARQGAANQVRGTDRTAHQDG